jgi:hypothetical protein
MLATHGSSTDESCSWAQLEQSYSLLFYKQTRAAIAERLHIRGYTNEHGSNVHIDMLLNVFVYLFVRNECDVVIKSGQTFVCFLVN